MPSSFLFRADFALALPLRSVKSSEIKLTPSRKPTSATGEGSHESPIMTPTVLMPETGKIA